MVPYCFVNNPPEKEETVRVLYFHVMGNFPVEPRSVYFQWCLLVPPWLRFKQAAGGWGEKIVVDDSAAMKHQQSFFCFIFFFSSICNGDKEMMEAEK